MLFCCEALCAGFLGCADGAAVWLSGCPCRGPKLYTARMPSPACMQGCKLLTLASVSASIPLCSAHAFRHLKLE